MSQYFSNVSWRRKHDEKFIDQKYSRGHEWRFDGGLKIPASSSPHVVPLPYSVESNIDPEEAFLASLSSCHMLFFLSIAAKKKFVVDQYVDNAIGVMEKDQGGNMSMTKVTLRPKVAFAGDRKPSSDQIEKIHTLAHEQCFIANSVKTRVVIEPAV